MSAFDGNRDGRTDNFERQDAKEFDRGDRNDDGALNRAEFGKTDDIREFGKYDTNRDGLVDSPEYARGEAEEHRRGR